MAKALLGVDISSNDIKMALIKGNSKILVNDRLPDNLVRDNKIVSYSLLAKHIRQMARKNGIHATRCAAILPDFSTLFKHLSVPAMSVEQLALNLPYEFRDYVGNDTGNYFYDYVVEQTNLDENGEPASFDLMAAAAQKSVIKDYSAMFRRAGLHLVRALPREMAIVNVIKNRHESNPDEQKDYFITDIGFTHTRIYIFKGNSLDASKIYDIGCRQIDEAIAAEYNIDVHRAATYRETNFENSLSIPECKFIFDRISIEVRKVKNFYAYNNRESELSEIYLCGDGAGIKPLVDTISRDTNLVPHGIDELIPESSQAGADIIRCAMAIGVAL